MVTSYFLQRHASLSYTSIIAKCSTKIIIMANMYSISLLFFSSRRRHTRFDCDWSSDVCSSDLGAAAERLVPGLVVDVLHDLAHQVDPGGEDPGYDSRGRVSDREGAVYERQAPEERHGHVPRQAAALEHGRIQPEHGEGREAHEHRGPVDEGRGAEPDHGPTRDAQVGGEIGRAHVRNSVTV